MPAIVDFRCIIDPKTFKIEVRASKPISKGDEITTRYFTPWEGQPARREHIKTHWGFICKCHRCKSPSDLDTNFRWSRVFLALLCILRTVVKDLRFFFSAIRCVDSPCEGYMLPESNLENARSRWICSKCGTHMESAQVEQMLKQLAPRMEDSHPTTIPDLIRELEKTSLHPNHYLIFGLKETYMYSSQVRLPTVVQSYKSFQSYSHSTPLMNDHIMNVNWIVVFEWGEIDNPSLIYHSFYTRTYLQVPSDELESLSTRIRYNQEVLDLVQVLDPGYTVRSAALMKNLATSRIELSKMKMKNNQLSKVDHLKEVRSAIGALKIVQAMTFQCPENAPSRTTK